MPRLVALALLLMLAAFALPTSHAQSGIHRCVSANGENIYTDRSCSELQAIDRPAPNSVESNGRHIVIARTCARKPDELLFDVRNALENQDVNRLAGTYHWTGMGSREAYSLMSRLSAFSARPLIDAQLISRAPMLDQPQDDAATDADSPGADATEETPAPAPMRPAPELIRVDQTSSANDATATTSYFRIVPAAGCLWISF